MSFGVRGSCSRRGSPFRRLSTMFGPSCLLPVAFDTSYLLTLLLITALFITLANRLWTMEKLMRYART